MKLYGPDGEEIELGREPTPEELAQEKAQLEADAQMAAGTRIKIVRDPDDDCWDLVTLRIPNAKMFGDDDHATEECDLEGVPARWRLIRFAMALASSLGAMFNAPDIFTKVATVIYNEARTQEVLGSMSEDERAKLIAASALESGKA